MAEWLAGLTGRQRVGFGLYVAGIVAAVGSLPMTFYGTGRDAESTWETIIEVSVFMYQMPDALIVDTWAEMVEGPLPVLFLLLSYLLAIPGILLLFLASRNAWFCWSGRMLWPVLFIAGPLTLLLGVGDGYPEFKEGCRVWGLWVLMIAAAHWVVAPRALLDNGQTASVAGP